MFKSYRYRLFPTKSQVRILERQLELCRQVYNDTLAYRKNAWEKEQRTAKCFETQDRLPQPNIPNLALDWYLASFISQRSEISRSSCIGKLKVRSKPVICKMPTGKWFACFMISQIKLATNW